MLFKNISFAFFSLCIILVIQLFFLSPNHEISKEILLFCLVYGGICLFWEIVRIVNQRSYLNYKILFSRAIGAAFGLLGGFYCGYLFCILVGIMNSTSSFESSAVESSAIAVGISFGSGEAGRQMGLFCSSVLLSE
jgi:hypothetical protein